MRLVRVGEKGSERAGVMVGNSQYIDVSDIVEDFNEAFFGSGALQALPEVISLRVEAGLARDLGDARIGAPIARPHQILCVGLNYVDHASESSMTVPAEPILFTKSPNTLVGPNDDVQIPRKSVKTDWEVELAFVVGRRSSYLASEQEARENIAGYVLVNDVSEREFQLEHGGQWSKGKSSPTFNPAGPFLVTPDEIADVNSLEIWLDVDGVRRQSGNTADMIFSPAFILHYASQFLTLEPGDLINTGTPPGVGMGHNPPIYLKGGEVVSLGVEGLGVQVQKVLPSF